MKGVTLSTFLFLFALSSFAQQQCTIKGEIIDRNSKVLLIHRYSEGYNSFKENQTKIPIKKGRFEYTFSYTEPEAYELIFEDEAKQGTWIAIPFFPTNGIVEFKLHPKDQWERNTITGGQLNDELKAYQQYTNQLFDKRMNELMKIQTELTEKNEYNSAAYEELRQRLKATKANDQDAKALIYQEMDELQKTHARYTEKAKRLFVDPYDSLSRAEHVIKYEYIRTNVSLASYYLIWKDADMFMKSSPLVAQLVSNVFPLYQKTYPEHIYTKLLERQVAGLRTIHIGGQYIDFKAPSLEGDSIQLSSVIQNQVALIDFWGSWCGPCIAKSRMVVPIYEQYKDKGFKIVGIAREFKNTDAVKKRLSKENFSWLNLVELDDKLNLWNTYGISNGTGLMILVDKDGTILSLDPKPEELEKILLQKL
ncbi:MAG: redoxin domain-containing protein [Cyclobacteriaceae bacterium]|nr:redoxin domain-containing protein [Cyclobacteriaceae bacterium]